MRLPRITFPWRLPRISFRGRFPRINYRFLFYSLIPLGLVLGGFYFWSWWSTRPDNVYRSALGYFREAEQARKKGEWGQAKNLYESADKRLRTLLEQAKAQPYHGQALVLRAKVLLPLAPLVGREEQERNAPSDQPAKIFAEAMSCADRVASADRGNVEAQAILMDYYFKMEDYERAEPYARNLVDHLPGTSPDLEGFANYVAGAYFVLARAALQPRPTPDPDKALDLVRSGIEWELKEAADGVAGKVPPRWRSVGLEVRALKIKADREENAEENRNLKSEIRNLPGHLLLQATLASGLSRVRTELGEGTETTTDKNLPSKFAGLSASNSRGLFEFLLLSIETAPDSASVEERTDLFLKVGETIASVPARSLPAWRGALLAITSLPLILDKLPPSWLPRAEGRTKWNGRIDKIVTQALEEGGLDAETYLRMAVSTHGGGNLVQALRLARKGLEAARAQNLPPQHNLVLLLHEELGWLLLMQHKDNEAEKEHLTELAKHKPMTVRYLRGLRAVRDGRLEQGIQELLEAQTSPEYTQKVPLLFGLGLAFLGQEKYDRAIPIFEKLEAYYQKTTRIDLEDELYKQEWMPDLLSIRLNLMYCHLALSRQSGLEGWQQEEHLKLAVPYQAKLKNTSAGLTAKFLLVNAHLARARTLYLSQPSRADSARTAAQQILESIPSARRNDPRFVWAEVNLLLNDPPHDLLLAASTVQLLLGPFPERLVWLRELGRSEAGLAWQWHQAEQLVAGLAAQKDNFQAQLSWVRWLQIRGRLEEALAYLGQLEPRVGPGDDKRVVQLYRASLMLRQGPSEEVRQLIENLAKADPDPGPGLLDISSLPPGGDKNFFSEQLRRALRRHEQSGLLQYWEGQLYQARGQFREALHSYEGALQFTQIKNLAENALLTCVLGLAASTKEGPQAAFQEAKRLATSYPQHPGVLLAYAVTARQMDNIYGPEGMQGALLEMQKALVRDGRPVTVGAELAAGQWILAGRPDLARKELVEKALLVTQGQVPLLVRAIQLAIEDEDWQAAQPLILVLQKINPNLSLIQACQASILLGLGKTAEARKIYENYVVRYPEQSLGYLALAGILQEAGDLAQALDWIQRFRQKNPYELNALRSHVHLLTRSGNLKEAEELGEAVLKYGWQALPEDRASAELKIVLAVAGGLQDGEAYGPALAWLREKGEPFLNRIPVPERVKENRLALQLVEATLYEKQGRLAKDPAQRVDLMDRAIALYRRVWQASPGQIVAGNNLAWLLVQEKVNPAAALEMIEEVRRGRYSRKPIGGERLPLAILDTLGVVYRAAGRNQEALELFKEAEKRYSLEPRIQYHLGCSLAALGKNKEANLRFKDAVAKATVLLKTTIDPQRKAKLTVLIQETRAELDRPQRKPI